MFHVKQKYKKQKRNNEIDQFITEAVLDVSACTTNIDDAADFTIPIGTTIYGQFDSLSIDSGSILAYKG